MKNKREISNALKGVIDSLRAFAEKNPIKKLPDAFGYPEPVESHSTPRHYIEYQGRSDGYTLAILHPSVGQPKMLLSIRTDAFVDKCWLCKFKALAEHTAYVEERKNEA